MIVAEEVTMDTLLEQFRNEAESRTTVRYAKELRDIAVQYARQQKQMGRGLTPVAKELGVTVVSLRAWMTEADSSFLPVEVCAGSERVDNGTQGGAGLHLVSPCGYRVEGLSVESAYQLLRLLG